jgi:hypothetical protein
MSKHIFLGKVSSATKSSAPYPIDPDANPGAHLKTISPLRTEEDDLVDRPSVEAQ